MFFTAAIGLPLTVGQPVVFGVALAWGDWASALTTLWWGPGFVAIAALVIWSSMLDGASIGVNRA